MADFAAPTPEDDQQPAPSEATVAEAAPVAEAEAAGTATEAADTETDRPAAETAAPDTQSAPPAADPPEPAAEPAAEVAPVVEPIAPVEPAAAEPVPAAEPAAPAAAVVPPAIDGPSIASTIEVPASAPAETGGEGGEWELLVQKLSTWLSSGQLQQQWQTARKPLSLLAGLIALLLVLRIYAALLAVIEGLPLLPGLLELVGVIAVVRFSLTRLVRSEERQQLVAGLQQRWKSFRGQG